MSIAPYIESLEAELLAASEHLPTHATAEEAQLALERAGDALRAGLSLPTALSRWNIALGDDVLAGALALGVEVLGDLVLPGVSDSHLVDLAAVARDRVESLLVGARHACIASGRVVEDVDGHGALLTARARVDERLRAVVTRQDLEAALGERRALLARSSWTDAFGEEGAEDVAGSDRVPDRLSSLGAPNDAVLTEYVERGLHARWVEGFAARDRDFAEELDASIAALREAGESVGLTARRWQGGRARGPRTDASTAIVVQLSELQLRDAAASEDAASESTFVQLGVLHPTEAEAVLEVRADAVRLSVYSAAGHLRRVRFGSAEVSVAADAEATVLEETSSNAPWALEVEAVDGARFEVVLGLGAGE